MAEQMLADMKVQMEQMPASMQSLVAENSQMKQESARYAEKVRADVATTEAKMMTRSLDL